jgi:hypothetical protein
MAFQALAAGHGFMACANEDFTLVRSGNIIAAAPAITVPLP